jgi:hypothetical protein
LNVALKRARQLALLPFTAEHIRITGVLVREPGAPPFGRSRGPRPVEVDGAEAPAPEAVVAANGAVEPAEAQPAPPETPSTEPPAAEAPSEAPAAPAPVAQEA